MEIVAMDMKVSGMYIARQLSFSGVSFRIEEIGLDSDFKLVYNKAARLVGPRVLFVCVFSHLTLNALTGWNPVSAVGRGTAVVHARGRRTGPGEQEVAVGPVLVVSPALFQIPLHRRQGPLPGGAGQERTGGRKGQHNLPPSDPPAESRCIYYPQ